MIFLRHYIFQKENTGYGKNTKFGSRYKWNWFNYPFKRDVLLLFLLGNEIFFPCPFPFNSSSREAHHSYRNGLCILNKSLSPQYKLLYLSFAVQTLICIPDKTILNNNFFTFFVFYASLLYCQIYFNTLCHLFRHNSCLTLTFVFETKDHVS